MEQAAHLQSSTLPSTSQDRTHPVTVSSVNWEHWLTTLRALPADASEWEGVSNFVKAVQQLSDAKRLERESTHRLHSMLMSLAAEHSEALDFFGLTDEVLEWTGVSYPPSEVRSLVDLIGTLQTHLVKHWNLYQRPSAATLTEERAKRRALLELEEDITGVYERLVATLRTASTGPESHRTSSERSEGIGTNAQPQSKAATHTSPGEPSPFQFVKLASPDTAAFQFAKTATQKAAAKASESAAEAPSAEPAPPSVPAPSEPTHTHLDSAARQYNPLTRAQERQLNSIRSGIGLIFSSEALGCSHIIEAYKRFAPIDLPEGSTAHCQEIPSKVANSDQLEHWLEQYVKEHQQGTRLVAYRPLNSGAKEHLIEQVQAALDVCKRPANGQRPWLGVTFIFDAKATWSWLSLPLQYREAVEDEADTVVFPWRWDMAGIRERLSQHHKLDSDEVCEQILHATGGWPYLLDVLFYRCSSQKDPRPFAQSIEKEITENSSKLVQQFWHCLGLDTNGSPQKVLEFLHRHKQAPLDLTPANANEIELPLPSAAYAATLEYLRRLGCVESKDGMLTVEPIVSRVLSAS